MRYHGEASDLPHGDVELPQVQRLLAHGGQLSHGRAPLLHEGQVALHPAPPLGLRPQLKQPRDSLSAEGGGGVRVGLLEEPRRGKEKSVYANAMQIQSVTLYTPHP